MTSKSLLLAVGEQGVFVLMPDNSCILERKDQRPDPSVTLTCLFVLSPTEPEVFIRLRS